MRRTALAVAAAMLCAVTASLALAGPSVALFYRHEYLPNLSISRHLVATGFGFHSVQLAFDNDLTSRAAGELYVANDYGQPYGGVFRFEVESEKYRYDCDISGPTTTTDNTEHECGSVSAMPTKEINPTAVAVDQATGDVYVGSPTEKIVDEFEPSGNFIAQFDGEDTPAGSFEPSRLAVSATGDVYVLDSAHDVIDVFTAAASSAYSCQITGHGSTSGTAVSPSECDASTQGTPTGSLGTEALALDESSLTPDLYVVNESGRVVDRFTAAGAYVSQLTGPEAAGGLSGTGEFSSPTGVAVEQSTGGLYVYDEGANYIDQFSSAGTYQGRTAPVEGSGEQLAVNQSDGDIYLDGGFEEPVEFCESCGEVEAWGPEIAIPVVETSAPAGVVQTSATLNGVVDPEGAEVASCFFQYGLTSSYGHRAPCEPSPGAGDAPVAVHAHVEGLLPGTSYHYRIVASYAAADSEAPGEDATFATLAPMIESESASAVGYDTATVEAQVDPEGVNVTGCRFEYRSVSEAAFEAADTVSCSSSPGAANASVTVSATIALSAGTAYRYRVALTNEFGTVHGEERALVAEVAPALTGPLALVDGRQWELVSPPNLYGGRLKAPGGNEPEGIYEAAADGGAMTYVSVGATEADAQGSAGDVQVLSSRGASSWSSRDISTPHDEIVGAATNHDEYRFFSPDLSTAVVQPQGPFAPLERCTATGCEPETFPAATEQTAYLRHDTTCETEVSTCYEPLVTAADGCEDVPAGTRFGGEVEFFAASADGKHVVVNTPLGVSEWSADEPCGERLSEPIGGAPGVNGKEASTRNAVSEDGSRIFWNEPREGRGYVEMTDLARKETLQIGGGDALYQTASANGAVVLYTEYAPEGKLFACRIVESAGKLACETTDLAPAGGEMASIVFASEDGSYVYFVATGALSGAAASPTGETAVAGRPNLYMRHYDAAAEAWEAPRLIAVLSTQEVNAYFGGLGGTYTELAGTTARVSPNGQWFAFMSSGSPTGYDNRDVNSGEPDAEVYLYHAPNVAGEEGKLDCVSCNPTGTRPVGRLAAAFELLSNSPGGWFSGTISRWNETDYFGVLDHQPRYLSDDGRVFFDSAEALVPPDVNGAVDVYEYEPPGVGTCTAAIGTYSEQDQGCVGLISAGSSSEESAFLDASESGGDVFFFTTAKLVRQDAGNAYAVYDAHVCSEAASCYPESPSAPPSCAGVEECREASRQQPAVFGPAPSATFFGAGDVAPPPTVTKLTRKQKLAKALRACHQDKKRGRRSACEKQARRRYRSKGSAAGDAKRKTGRSNGKQGR